jgi:hypothetical protein
VPQVLDRGTQADARGATHVLDRGVQAVARGAARCALHVHGRDARSDACDRSFAVLSTHSFNSLFSPAARSAKTNACGRSFAVVSTQVSTVGLRLGWRVAESLK